MRLYDLKQKIIRPYLTLPLQFLHVPVFERVCDTVLKFWGIWFRTPRTETWFRNASYRSFRRPWILRIQTETFVSPDDVSLILTLSYLVGRIFFLLTQSFETYFYKKNVGVEEICGGVLLFFFAWKKHVKTLRIKFVSR